MEPMILSIYGMEITTTQLDGGFFMTLTQLLIFGLPINKKIGASFGIIPYSNIGYTLENRDENYNANMLYNGDGGISKVYLGGALKLHKNISVGGNASYLFGGLNRRKKLDFDS